MSSGDQLSPDYDREDELKRELEKAEHWQCPKCKRWNGPWTNCRSSYDTGVPCDGKAPRSIVERRAEQKVQQTIVRLEEDRLNASCTMQVKYRTPQVEKMLPLQHAKPGDCGYDLGYSPDPQFEGMTDGVMRVFPHTFKLVPTGVSVKIPDGYFGLLCGRSSTFGKRGLFVVESRIDSGYTGELFVKVWHPSVFGGDYQQSPTPAVIRPWERFAQIMVLPYVSPTLEVVSELPATERGTSGFGSSGGFTAKR